MFKKHLQIYLKKIEFQYIVFNLKLVKFIYLAMFKKHMQIYLKKIEFQYIVFNLKPVKFIKIHLYHGSTMRLLLELFTKQGK